MGKQVRAGFSTKTIRHDGAPITRTRVPVIALFENLEDGATTDDFLEWFPGVRRSQVEAVLQHAENSLLVPGAP